MKWDIVDQIEPNVVEARSTARNSRNGLVSVAVSSLVFCSIAAFSFPGVISSQPVSGTATTLRLARGAPTSRLRSYVRGEATEHDTQLGMSSPKLAIVFSNLFRPALPEDESDEAYNFGA